MVTFLYVAPSSVVISRADTIEIMHRVTKQKTNSFIFRTSPVYLLYKNSQPESQIKHITRQIS